MASGDRFKAATAALLGALLVACGAGEGQAPSEPAGTAADAASPDEGPVRLFCSEPTFDFGSIWEGDYVEHTFELEVRGAGELALQAVRASCGCTAPSLTLADGTPYVFGTPLATGTRLALDVRFASQNRQGAQDRPVTLYGNLPEGGRYVVNLTGDVGPYLAPTSEEAAIGRLLPSEERFTTVALSTADGSPARLAVVPHPSQPAELHAELTNVEGLRDAASSEWILAVRVSAADVAGSFHWPLRVETLDDDGQRSGVGTSIFVKWERVLPIAAEPRVFSFGTLGPGRPASASVRLASNSDAVQPGAVDLTGARIELDEVSADLAEVLNVEVREADGQRLLELSTPGLPERYQGRVLGRVVIPVGVLGQELLEIPIDGFATGRR